MAQMLMNYLANQNNNRNEEYLDDPNTYETATLLIQSSLPDLEITKVQVVHNNYLRGMYELKKMEYKSRYGSVEEKTLVHATSASNVNSIIKNNLDWRRVTRNKYGKGVSFSGDADYANFHSNSANGSARAFIVASVLVSKAVIGNCYMEIPSSNADTSISNTGKVYVKYNDNEFLPKYVVYYTAPDRSESTHYRRFRRRRYF